MNAAAGFVIRTGNLEQDRYEVARYQQHYASQGLQVAAEPLADGGFLLRIYPARHSSPPSPGAVQGSQHPSAPPQELSALRALPRTQAMQRVPERSGVGPAPGPAARAYGDPETQDAAAFGFVGFETPARPATPVGPSEVALGNSATLASANAGLPAPPFVHSNAPVHPSSPPGYPNAHPSSPPERPSNPPNAGYGAQSGVAPTVGFNALPIQTDARPNVQRSFRTVLLILLIGVLLGAVFGYVALKYSAELSGLY